MSKVAESGQGWAVLARACGEFLTAEAEHAGAYLALLGVPPGYTVHDARTWLTEVLAVARKAADLPGERREIPALLHQALTALLSSHVMVRERARRGVRAEAPARMRRGRRRSSDAPRRPPDADSGKVPSTPRPCSCAFVDAGEQVGFGWAGEAEVALWVDGEPHEPHWAVVTGEGGRSARAWCWPANHVVQVSLLWSGSPGDPRAGGAQVEAMWTPERRHSLVTGAAPEAAAGTRTNLGTGGWTGPWVSEPEGAPPGEEPPNVQIVAAEECATSPTGGSATVDAVATLETAQQVEATGVEAETGTEEEAAHWQAVAEAVGSLGVVSPTEAGARAPGLTDDGSQAAGEASEDLGPGGDTTGDLPSAAEASDPAEAPPDTPTIGEGTRATAAGAAGSGFAGWLRRCFSWLGRGRSPAQDPPAAPGEGGSPDVMPPAASPGEGEGHGGSPQATPEPVTREAPCLQAGVEDESPPDSAPMPPEGEPAWSTADELVVHEDPSVAPAAHGAGEVPAPPERLSPPVQEPGLVAAAALADLIPPGNESAGASAPPARTPQAPSVWLGRPGRVAPGPWPAELGDRGREGAAAEDPHVIDLPPDAGDGPSPPREPLTSIATAAGEEREAPRVTGPGQPAATPASVPTPPAVVAHLSSVDPRPEGGSAAAPAPAVSPEPAVALAQSAPAPDVWPESAAAPAQSASAPDVWPESAAALAQSASAPAVSPESAAAPVLAETGAPAQSAPASDVSPESAAALAQSAPAPAVSPESAAAPVPAASAPAVSTEPAIAPAPSAPVGGSRLRPPYPVREDSVLRSSVGVPRRPAWPSAQQLARSSSPVGGRRWVWLMVVVALFAGGWYVGTLQDAGRGTLMRALHAVGLGGPRFTLEVTSRPPGAGIAVDGRLLPERTPAVIGLPAGERRIALSFPDLGGATYTVRGRKGERVPLEATLWGAIEIHSPLEVGVIAVAVDGRPRGFAPLRVDSLRPGVHEVRFSAPAMVPWGQTVAVRVGETREVLARSNPSPATGVLQVEATLTDAQGTQSLSGGQIWIDGEPRGGAPLTLDLPRGPHSVRMVYRGQEAPVQVIDLPGGNHRFAVFDFGLDQDLPRLAVSAPARIPRDRPAVVSASASGVLAPQVREMWLHVQMPGGPWRRHAMTLLKAPAGTVGAAVFPIAAFDPQGRTRYYLSVQLVAGEELFSEIRTIPLEAESGR